MLASIITIGDEILIGQTVDTNSAWLGRKLTQIGVELRQVHSISDSPEEIVRALDEALVLSDLVILTGGLGPTNDDLTKNTLVDYFGTSLVLDQEVLDKIENYFISRNYKILDVHRHQALLPANADKLINNYGSATGMWFEKDAKVIISLPGVPGEMKGIMRDFALEKIKDHFQLPNRFHRTILTWGRGESFIAEKISDWEEGCKKEDVGVAYLPSAGIVKIRISKQGIEEDVAEMVNKKAEELYALIPKYIFGEDEEKLEEKVGELLRSKNLTIATAESCTGGYLAHMLTSVAGSSDYFKGSVVSYTNEIKENFLNVSSDLLKDKGAVNEEVVIQMASNIREKFNTDFAISTSGYAGPEGGDEVFPVGSIWIAIASKSGVNTKLLRFGNKRLNNIKVSSIVCLGRLLKEIQD